MASMSIEANTFTQNPLDIVEEMVSANDWAFERASNDEMLVEVAGRWCNYRMFFFWQDEISAMQFCCQYDMKVPAGRGTAVHELLATINERMWLGHFDLWSEDAVPMYRHGVLIRGGGAPNFDQMEELAKLAGELGAELRSEAFH